MIPLSVYLHNLYFEAIGLCILSTWLVAQLSRAQHRSSCRRQIHGSNRRPDHPGERGGISWAVWR